jgi:hypothetical protein
VQYQCDDAHLHATSPVRSLVTAEAHCLLVKNFAQIFCSLARSEALTDLSARVNAGFQEWKIQRRHVSHPGVRWWQLVQKVQLKNLFTSRVTSRLLSNAGKCAI